MAGFARYPSLEGKSVLVSGGGSGIGAAIVEEFCGQGARVALIDVDPAAAAATAERVAGATGNRPLVSVTDLRDVAALRQAVADLAAATGPFQVLVNNAGNDDRHAVEEVEPAYWDERFAVNLRHQFFLAQAVAGPMAAAGAGSIVNFGSISWMFGAAGLICYTTAKAAVAGMTKSLARELGAKGIRVNCVAPGWILTDRQIERARRLYPEKFADYLQRQCLKEHLLPPDVGRMVLWLAADDSRLVTGQTFIIDGGVI